MKMVHSATVALGCFVMGGIGMVSCAQKTTVDPAAQEKVMRAMRAQEKADIRAIDAAWAKAVERR